ncbi:uncharacterized protein LOC144902418 isoform X2 [Branchiostoma floridae x Branchiostoma belcheri]
MHLLSTLLLFALSFPFFYIPSGTNGLEQTGNCTAVDGTTCNVTNATSAGGFCAPGWTGPDCDVACADGSFGQNCSGVCFCVDGHPCDVINGSCPDDICAPGWQGDTCSLACRFGTFGANCNQECHCGSGTCDPVEGNCTGGICAAGWQGETCSTACGSGTFGPNCNGTCHCQEDSCDVTTGQCPDNVCGPGWQGPICQQSCDSGLYGEECSQTCNCRQNEDCDHVTGTCPSGCPPDWAGEACQYRIPPPPKSITVSNVTETTAILEWSHSDTEPYGYIVQYRFYPYHADDQWQNSTIIHGALNTYTINNLHPATEYIYNVMAVSGDGIKSTIPDITVLINMKFTTSGDTTPTAGGLSSGAVAGIVLGTLASVTVIVGITVYFFRRKGNDEVEKTHRRGGHQSNQSEDPTYNVCDESGYLSPLDSPPAVPTSGPQSSVYAMATFAQNMAVPQGFWEIPETHLEVHKKEKLGHGYFSKVYKGMLKKRGRRYPVAVKISKAPSSTGFDDFKKELLLVSEVAHVGENENIVKFMGAVTHEKFWLVFEFADRGNLKKWLEDKENIPKKYRTPDMIHCLMPYSNHPTPLRRLLGFGLDICKGMMHLTKAEVNHGDLAARNVLLFSKGEFDITAKITDFGLSEDLYKAEEETGNHEGAYKITKKTFPVKWSSPEVLMKGEFTAKSDVWSFGVLLWEIFTFGEKPHKEIKNGPQLIEHLNKGERLACPAVCPAKVYKVMKSCWMMEAGERPGFEDLFNELEKIWLALANNVGERINPAYVPDNNDDNDDNVDNVEYVDMSSGKDTDSVEYVDVMPSGQK